MLLFLVTGRCTLRAYWNCSNSIMTSAGTLAKSEPSGNRLGSNAALIFFWSRRVVEHASRRRKLLWDRRGFVIQRFRVGCGLKEPSVKVTRLVENPIMGTGRAAEPPVRSKGTSNTDLHVLCLRPAEELKDATHR